ncbi:protein ecdysoneless [Agrilus planipennis]|uniref:Protein ecdysoneless n=1 Tax=Agrilus planipennis TaxID=224129 RepID=A0A1W4WN51_AGRPL|nr:protein ecdysoneless [Agrilus planipennis]
MSLKNKIVMAFSENVRDDFVEYFIFPLEEKENHLTDLLINVQTTVDKYSAGYIWHLDEFKVITQFPECHVLKDDYNSLPPHLYGILHYGENIEDEWFTVYLLLQITKDISDVCIRVVDSDGEFLLIEAANHLPNWAKPETCNKRVYIYQGSVHLVRSIKNEAEINIHSTIKMIAENPRKTEASPEIQNAVLHRISNYPERMSENLHKTIAYVPVGVAAILKNQPRMISHAVRAFCLRDSIDMKACRAMKFFPPENRVYISIVMTKFLYAMLTHSKYTPDKRTGWSLPSPNSTEYKKHLLGVKIACGFEILASQAKQDSDLDNDKVWSKFVEGLNNKGYFNGTVEHSVAYNNLLNKAEAYYRSFKNLIPTPGDVGLRVVNLVKNLHCNIEDFSQEDKSFQEDSDSWLNIDPKELDNLLMEHYGSLGSSNTYDLSNKIESFLNHVSDIDGAEFPENKLTEAPMPPSRGKKIEKGKGKTSLSTGDSTINFDANAFSCAVQNMLDLVIPEDNWDLESDSDLSVYADEESVHKDECGSFKSQMKEYMDLMDKELAGTSVGRSFVKQESTKDEETNFDDVEDFSPVDINLNALKNVLESYRAQMGEAGPASNLLGPMGVNLANVNLKDRKNRDIDTT